MSNYFTIFLNLVLDVQQLDFGLRWNAHILYCIFAEKGAMCVGTLCGHYLTILNGAVVLVCDLASTMSMFLMVWNATQKPLQIGSKNSFGTNQLAHPQTTRVKSLGVGSKRLNTIQVVYVHYVEQKLQMFSRKSPFIWGWGIL